MIFCGCYNEKRGQPHEILEKTGYIYIGSSGDCRNFAVVIAMNWELFSAMPQQMERMQGAATCSTLIFVSVQGKAKPASDASSVQRED